jgi:hypothetical protein
VEAPVVAAEPGMRPSSFDRFSDQMKHFGGKLSVKSKSYTQKSIHPLFIYFFSRRSGP